MAGATFGAFANSGQICMSTERIIVDEAVAEEFISKLPLGYDTPAGEAGMRLSGGEKQRIAIARMMLKNAPIIILDEATANVDPENEDRLQRAIEALTGGKTIIMIAPRRCWKTRRSVYRRCDCFPGGYRKTAEQKPH